MPDINTAERIDLFSDGNSTNVHTNTQASSTKHEHTKQHTLFDVYSSLQATGRQQAQLFMGSLCSNKKSGRFVP